MAASLSGASRLRKLYIAETDLTDSGCEAFAEGLAQTQYLFHLDISDNPALTQKGLQAISAAMTRNESLRSIDLGNLDEQPEHHLICNHIASACSSNSIKAEEQSSELLDCLQASYDDKKEQTWATCTIPQVIEVIILTERVCLLAQDTLSSKSPEMVAISTNAMVLTKSLSQLLQAVEISSCLAPKETIRGPSLCLSCCMLCLRFF